MTQIGQFQAGSSVVFEQQFVTDTSHEEFVGSLKRIYIQNREVDVPGTNRNDPGGQFHG